MTARLLEQVYLRTILDARFAEALRDGDSEATAGLDAGSLAALRAIPEAALQVERRGRWLALWGRCRVELPATTVALETLCELRGESLAALWRDYFGAEFWALRETLPVGPWGQGRERASTLRAFVRRRAAQLEGHAGWALVRDLAELEWNRFRANLGLATQRSAGRSCFDLASALVDPRRVLAGITEPEPLTSRYGWWVEPDGRVGVEGLRAEPSRATARLATILDPRVRALLTGPRLDRYHTAATLYFALGEEAARIDASHRRLIQRVVAQRSGQALGLDPQLASLFTSDGDAWWLADSVYFRPTPSLLDGGAALSFVGRDGVVRRRYELDRETLAAFGQLLPRLRPSSAATELGRLGPRARTLLAELEAAGLVCEAPLRRITPRSDYAVTLVGHASLLFEGPRTRVLVDPLITVRNRPDIDASAVLDGPLDAIVLTHCHWDHLNFDTLMLIDRRTPVVVPRRRHRASITNLDMAGLCRELGFERVVSVDPWSRVRVAELELTVLPFHGETAGPGAPRDWMTYLVELGGRRVCGLVDAVRDPFGDMDEVLRVVHRAGGPVDLLFAPCSEFRYPVYNYTRRPFFVSHERERYTGGPDDVTRWAALLEAGLVIPYALFHLCADDLARDSADAARDEFRFGSIEALAERLPIAPEGPMFPLEPGASLAWTRGGPVIHQPEALAIRRFPEADPRGPRP